MSCRSVLVVEDDEDIRTKLAEALAFEGYAVLTAEHGVRALEVLRGLRPEEMPGCMLLDLRMPEMDGKTLLTVIPQRRRLRETNRE